MFKRGLGTQAEAATAQHEGWITCVVISSSRL